jgi:hypothetical protein
MAILQKTDLSSASFVNNNSIATQGITVRTDAGSTVKAAIDAAITAAVTALPADKYVSSMASYNPTTNIATFNLNGGGTVNVDFTALVADAVASATAGKTPLYGNDDTTVLGYLLPA